MAGRVAAGCGLRAAGCGLRAAGELFGGRARALEVQATTGHSGRRVRLGCVSPTCVPGQAL
ncbi:hypothetical protein GCM10027258_43540 [Amycolatopsis stemonae]